jgi:nicotinamidase-related amidase
MQAGIVGQISDGAAVTERVGRVLDCAWSRGIRVIFTRHMSLPPKLMGSFHLRQAMAWQKLDNPDQVRPWFLRGSLAFEIVPELEPREDEAILDKITRSRRSKARPWQ